MATHVTGTTRIPLRWRDLDSQSHVFHGVHVALFDQARAAMLGDALGTADLEYVVVRLEIDYSAELTLADSPVGVNCSVAGLGNTSIVLVEKMHTATGALVASTRAVIVLWDVATRTPRALTLADRRALGRQ
nr:acyl-CoA thioesterase [Rhodococcus sp. (in: high G+C Gram-positive bacteria)]